MPKANFISRYEKKLARLSALALTSISLSFVANLAHAEPGPGIVADVSLTPAGDFKARTDEIKGEALKTGASFTAETITVHLNSLKTGLPLRDKHAKEKYLEVEKYPDAVLSNATGNNGKGTGKLKLHGIEREVTGTYNADDKFLYAEFQIKLSEFGITGIKYMGVGVDDDVKIHVTIALKK